MKQAVWLLGAALTWSILACSGTLGDDPEEEVSDEQPDGGKKPPKSRRRKKPSPDRGDVPEEGDTDEGGGGEGGGGDGGEASPAPSPSPSPSPSPAPVAPSGITDLGNNTWQVKRSLVNKWEDNPSRLGDASQKNQGFKLSSINNASDAYFVGLRNGDIVTSLNGHSMGSTGEALLAYAAVQNASTINVKLKRDGSSRTHKYKIVN